MADLLFAPTPHKQAVQHIAGKPAVSRAVFDHLLPELKGRAFTIAGIEALGVLTSVRDTIATLPAGGDWNEVKKQVLEDIQPYFVDESADAETQTAQRRAANRRAELLLRTHGQQAYAAAAYRDANEQRDLFPFWKYQSLGDGHVRASHAALDGVVLPHDHEFWATHTPPWDWGCRCQFIPLSEADVAEIQEADKALPPEKRSVLDDAQQKLLTEQRTLWRPANLATGEGHPVPFSVASAAEKGKPGAYSWHPGDLQLSLDDLRKRHDPADFALFEDWARKQKLPGRRLSVWQWLAGKPSALPTPPASAPQSLWPELAALKQIKSLGGSTGAMLVEAPDGRRFVMKRGASAEHLREEVAADALYQSLGVPVPAAQLYETAKGPVKLAEYIEGKTLSAATIAPYQEQIAQHFAADALLGNWDVAGLSYDNLLVDAGGKVWRVDNGGSLRFRAQGTKKTDAEWNGFATELWTLRDKAKNPVTANVFAKVDIYRAAEQIAKIDRTALLAAAPEDLRAVLGERLDNLTAIATKATAMKADRWKADYTEDLTRHMMGLRADGIISALPKKLSGAPGELVLKDENGDPFDHLRTIKAHAAKQTANDVFYDSIVAAAKTVNHHHEQGNVQYNAAKIATAEAHRTALVKLLATGTAPEKKLAKHYLGALDEIKATTGDLTKKVAKLAKLNLPADQKPTPDSLVTKLAAYIKAQGGDWSHVSTWAGEQSGSSQSKGAHAYKFFLSEQLDGVKPSDFFREPSASAYASAVPKQAQEAYRTAMIAHHAFIQELLAATEFDGNDVAQRRMRILRTETSAAAVPFKAGKKGLYPRGVNESGSLYRPVFSGARTITNVPHSRVTSLYFLERDPAAGGSFLHSDSENEATYMALGLPTLRVTKTHLNLTPGTDSTKWEI